MNAIKTITTRRSVRDFTDEKISDKDLETILDCAFSAPSACHASEWEVILIDEPELIEKMKDAIGNGAKPLNTAKQLILVLADTTKSVREFWHVDCSLFEENILLAARSLNIGSVYLGVYPIEHRMNKISEAFNLPSHIKPHGLLALGYPKDGEEAFKKTTEIDKSKVHYNKY